MKKVYVPVKLNDAQKKRLESISNEYEFVYEKDYSADIILGNVNPNELKEYKNLKWLQASAVGVDNYIKKGVLNDNVILTNAKDIHSKEVAEHIFAMILTMIKKLYLYRDNQKENLWHDEGKVKSINGLKVCVVGFGDIAKCLSKLLKGVGAYIIGVKRSAIEIPEHLDELYLSDKLDEAISDVDVVVSILPGTKENTNLFTLDRFINMKADTIFINAGRGNLYTEDTLCEVLDKHIIAGIGLDVYAKEPVEASSRLWGYKNLYMTPHVAGFFHLNEALDDYVDLLENNLKRYINNEKLIYVIEERE